MKKTYPCISHHGATQGVTGSCHRYEFSNDAHVLIDCGLFQGEGEPSNSLSRHRINFDISNVKALVITHVHIDHIGRLPHLIFAGFNGPIYCSIPSSVLLPLVIEDALKVGFTHDKGLINRFLKRVESLLRPLVYGRWEVLTEASTAESRLRVKLQRAGHILGSAFVEFDAKTQAGSHRAVFSGDLGAPYSPLLPAPKSPYRADELVIESTYGDKTHESRKNRTLRLKSAIDHALRNGGTVMIPAFSIGRTQELLYELEGLIARGGLQWQNLEIIVDSPLAAKFTDVYKKLKPYWDAEAKSRLAKGRHPLSFENLYTVGEHKEHLQTVQYLAKSGRPAVVIAASGMANGGRILNYLKAMLANPIHAVLFVGYQAGGTLGNKIQKIGFNRHSKRINKQSVYIDGKSVEVNAEIFTISGYSAHADQKDLVNFVKRMRYWPSVVRIVHGDMRAKKALKRELEALAKANAKSMKVLLPR